MRRPLAFLLALSLATSAAACLWDYDTLQMERERFPGALELIVGKFLRHTDEFYEWRVKDRRADIAAHDSGGKKLSDADLARTYDDLAAALDKLKRHDEAIATIREKAERLPKVGEYETHANLGTFLVHSGRLGEGVAELKKAVEINPDAHFGREKYQVLLVEYVMEKRGDAEKATLPLDGRTRSTDGPQAFSAWLLTRQGLMSNDGEFIGSVEAVQAEIDRAVAAVLGMMRFGDFRSPILLETLGDLLLNGTQRRPENDAQRLAARAYLRAAQATKLDRGQKAYRAFAESAVQDQIPDEKGGERSHGRYVELSLASVEDQLRREVQEADSWFAKTIAHDEELWIEKSPDPDRRFWEKYGGQDIRVGRDRLPAGQYAAGGLSWTIRAALGGTLLGTVGVLAAAMYWRRRRPTGYDGEPRT